MKRLWVVLLCLVLILTGCVSKKGDIDSAETSVENETKGEENHGEKGIDQSPSVHLPITKDTPDINTVVTNKPTLVIPQYEAMVKPYTIDNNLANIENMEQFTGFTKEQINKLVKNGFVVLPSQDTKMHYVYDSNEYRGVPNFITTDTVLHTFHQFYDKSLMHIESNYMYEDLELMTQQMLNKSFWLYSFLEDEELKKLQEKNIIYFLVAQLFMHPNMVISIDSNPNFIDIAKKEIELIEKASTFEKSPLFQIDLDYSQFKVRGHYTKTEELGKFFKTMMWYGTAPLPFFDEDKFLYENTLQALLLSFTTFLEAEEKNNARLWANIYIPTGQFVGLSDDIHVFAMNDLRESVYGKRNDPNIFNDEVYYDKLLEAVKALPEPKIQGKFSSVSTPTGKQFRFMGQRYILDSLIMQNLMEPNVRPIPSGLDVMGVLGSDLAENYLLNVLQPQIAWPEYEVNYRILEEEVAGYTEEVWGNNLYNGWLWTLQTALTEYDADSGMPSFMTNDAWRNKSLNAALGSYTELKHDTVLYGKQPAAQSGGPMEFEKPRHYVEPNVQLYSKLLYLTDYTVTVLEERGMLNRTMLGGANQFKDLLQLLITVSLKELQNIPLTEEENDQLFWYGANLEHIADTFLFGSTNDDSDVELSDMLVTDVATLAPTPIHSGGNLSLGTGFFDHIYVVVPNDGKLYLARGSVYSYFEFFSSTRLTDEEWWEMNGIKKVEGEYGTYLEWIEASKDLPEQPFWVDTFKSRTNDVQIEPIEVDWDKLNE